MQKNKIWLYGSIVLFFALLFKYSDYMLLALRLIVSISVPLLTGCVIAYILDILVVKIENLSIFRKSGRLGLYRARRPLSILGSLLIIAGVITLIINIIIPQLIDAFAVVISGIQPLLDEFTQWIVSNDILYPQIEAWIVSLDVNWPQLIEKALSYLTSGLGNVFSSAVSIVSSITGVVMHIVIAFIFAIYILAEKERLARQFNSLMEAYLKESIREKVMYVLITAHSVFTKFFVGQLVEAVILGFLCTVGMLIFRFPYATMIGTLIGATAILPIVGAYLGAFIGAFMILTVNPIQSVFFLIFIVVLQQLEGNLIYPRVVGSSIGLPGMWVLVAITIGGGIGGVIGMLLAVPTTATIYKLLRTDVYRRNTMALSKAKKTDNAKADSGGAAEA